MEGHRFQYLLMAGNTISEYIRERNIRQREMQREREKRTFDSASQSLSLNAITNHMQATQLFGEKIYRVVKNIM